MKKTRILFSLLMAVVMMAMSPQTLWALGGSGTSSSPYTIANASDLVTFASKVNGSEQGAYAKLTADITLTSAWTAMGTSSKPYTGTFDGQGHKISGLSLTATAANAGLFGYVNGATIKNFSLAGTVSSGYDNTGSVVGYAKGSSTIQDIVSTVNITMTAAKSHLGGIAGNIENGTSVLGCTYSGTLNASSSTDSNGGIVGFANANCSGTIKYCFFNGTLKTTSSSPVIGGILGYTNDESKNFGGVQNCYSCGTLSFGTSDYKYANAIVGRIRAKSSTTINNTFLSGTAARACNEDCDEKVDFTKNKAITISVTAITGGSVSQTYINPTSTTATKLQVEATPEEHYHFEYWRVTADGWDHNTRLDLTSSVDLTDNVSIIARFKIDEHQIVVIVGKGQTNMGTVSGGGTYDYGTQLTITATPNEHYHFSRWYPDDNTNASRQITVTRYAEYHAIFAPDQYTITVASNDVNYGTVSGGGTFDYNSSKTITATPKEHYHFVQWNDGVKTASRQISVTGNATYTATFEIDQHTITLKTNDSNMGTVSGGGTFDYNSQQTITATPKEHYHFVQWNDDNTNASRTITVTEDKTYTATFAIDQHTITVATNNGNYGTVTGGGAYNYGTQQTITATPEEHYHFVQWSDGNTNASRQITVNGNATYTATFAIDQHTITVQANNNNYGTVTGSGTYNYGTQQTITATPKTGYNFVQWSDGNTNASRQITVEDDATYTATFAPKAKAVLNNGTLTFYYDDIDHDGVTYPLNTGDYIPGWFKNRSSITSVVFDPNFAAARPTSCCSWFCYCNNLTSIIGLEHLNTEEVENMSYMFHYCTGLTSLDLKNFNTSNVIDMSYMFYYCDALESLTIGNFDMQNVTSFEGMFDACFSLNTLTMKSLPFLQEGTFDTQFSGDGKTVNVILDDNSAIYTDGTNNLPAATSATYTRTGIKNQWGTIVVPFELNGSGDDYDLYTITRVTADKLSLTPVEGILAAGTPAVICLKEGLAGNYNLTLTAANNAVNTAGSLQGSSADGLQLVGAYEATQLTDNDYFISNNKFWRAGDMSAPVKAAPFRAYLKNTTGSAKASALNIAVEDDSATAIDALNMLNDTDAQYYDLSGRRIPQLQKGMNIVKYGNGKTVKVNIK